MLLLTCLCLTWPCCVRVCGSYADMNAGTPVEALVDFTGGVHMCVQLSEPPADLWELMCRADQAKSLMGCGIPQGVRDDHTSANCKLRNPSRLRV